MTPPESAARQSCPDRQGRCTCIPQPAPTYTPGDRVRLTIEGTCVVGDTDHVCLQLDDGSTWHFLPAIAKIEKVER